MNWYKRHLGDYAKDTGHLSLLEHGVYGRMLDIYYSTEKSLPSDPRQLYRVLRAATEAEREAVDSIVAEFFMESSGTLTQGRVEAEIANHREVAETNRRIAEQRESRKRGERTVPEVTTKREQDCTVRSPETAESVNLAVSRKPIAVSQEQTAEAPQAAPAPKGSRLASDWTMTREFHVEALRIASEKLRPDLDIAGEAEKFRDYWNAKSGKDALKRDWLGTWRNWIRTACEGRPGRKPTPLGGNYMDDLMTVVIARSEQ